MDFPTNISLATFYERVANYKFSDPLTEFVTQHEIHSAEKASI